MCRRIAGCFFILILVALAAGAYVYFNITRPVSDPREKQALAPPTPAEKKLAKQATTRLERSAQAFAPAPGRPKPKRFELRVTEAELQAIMKTSPDVQKGLKQSGVKAPLIDFQPGRITLSARVPVGKLQARVSATGAVRAERGKLVYRTEAVRLGDFPAPKELSRLLDEQLKTSVRELNKQIQGRLDEVTVTDRELVLRGQP
jgi:hypothetical protein